MERPPTDGPKGNSKSVHPNTLDGNHNSPYMNTASDHVYDDPRAAIDLLAAEGKLDRRSLVQTRGKSAQSAKRLLNGLLNNKKTKRAKQRQEHKLRGTSKRRFEAMMSGGLGDEKGGKFSKTKDEIDSRHQLPATSALSVSNNSESKFKECTQCSRPTPPPCSQDDPSTRQELLEENRSAGNHVTHLDGSDGQHRHKDQTSREEIQFMGFSGIHAPVEKLKLEKDSEDDSSSGTATKSKKEKDDSCYGNHAAEPRKDEQEREANFIASSCPTKRLQHDDKAGPGCIHQAHHRNPESTGQKLGAGEPSANKTEERQRTPSPLYRILKKARRSRNTRMKDPTTVVFRRFAELNFEKIPQRPFMPSLSAEIANSPIQNIKEEVRYVESSDLKLVFAKTVGFKPNWSIVDRR